MSNILYPDFLKDEQEYAATTEHWTALFSGLMAQQGFNWSPYIKNQFGDGTPMRDGNPIFNAFVPRTGRAVRIIQHPPSPKDSFVTWKNETEWADGTHFTELVISLILTEKTEGQAIEAMKAWFSASTPTQN